MEILHLMVPIAIILVVIAIVIFFWAVRTGQFDDLERQGYSVLLDEDNEQPKSAAKKQQKQDTTNTNEANSKQGEKHTE
ncbi:cbb3-type cytochrome oxidase assembly protein CcoS [Aliidiomarina sp.]|uniref:cbb3-type cytochrome oxidase assembly protein CcoS n=1 Tax=Aliidiomarina sp. TaxID=1872439 RepID=UPI003A4D2E18